MSDEKQTKKRRLPRGIRLRPDGKFRLYVTGSNGRPMQPLVTWKLLGSLQCEIPSNTRQLTPGLELAKLALKKLQVRVMEETRTGVVASTTKTKVSDLYLLEESEYIQLQRKSLRDLRHRWANHLKPFFGDLAPVQVTTDRIDAYVRARQKDEASNGSINRELSALQHMFRLGQRCTPPKVQSAPFFRKLKESPARSGFLEVPEYDKLCAHATELWLRALLATAYNFAFRRGELLGLKVAQVNPSENTITLSDSKNGDPRVVCMVPEVATLLAALAQNKKPDDFVFTRDDGKRVKDFRATWKKLFEDAQVPFRLFHDLRRSGVRNLVRAGIHKDTCMKISGHRTDSVFRRYNVQSLTDFEEAAVKLAARAARLRAAAEEAAVTATKTATPPDQQPEARSTIQ
jgi:integrase